jgi:hypothetical protein
VPLSVEMLPLPVFKSPCHTALALRCMNFSLVRSDDFAAVIRFLRAFEGYIE